MWRRRRTNLYERHQRSHGIFRHSQEAVARGELLWMHIQRYEQELRTDLDSAESKTLPSMISTSQLMDVSLRSSRT